MYCEIYFLSVFLYMIGIATLSILGVHLVFYVNKQFKKLYNYNKSRMIIKKNNSGNSQIGFISLLTLIFITLKLVGIINWSWFWVLSPTILSISVALMILMSVILYAYFKG